MIDLTHNLQGQLLLANPFNPPDTLAQSVILITHCNNLGVRGVQINYILEEPTLDEIAQSFGIDFIGKDPVYAGGGLDVNKIHVIHSNDWIGLTTKLINNNLAITMDISVLAALSIGEGPKQFKACSGHWFWEHDVLEEQLSINNNKRYSWEIAESNNNIVFEVENDKIWKRSIELSAKQQVSTWF